MAKEGLFTRISSWFEGRRTRRQEKRKLRLGPQYSRIKELKKISGNYESFEELVNKKGKIGIILGARGSGKSALGMRIIENIKVKTDAKIFSLGFNPSKLPRWIKPLSSIDKIENDSFLIVDEGGIIFSSRSSMSNANKLLSYLLFISRHKNISIIFITQNSANLEVNTLRQADYLLLRKSSLLQLDFERKKIKDVYKEVSSSFSKYKEDKGLTYVYSDVYRGFVSNELPGFWTEGLSKSFSGVEI